MPKPRDIEALLQSKFGFSPAKSRGKDHRFYNLLMDGLPLIVTKVSHNKKELGKSLLSKIARQLRVHGKFFDEMFACKKSSVDYQNQVRSDPYPPFEVRL